MDPQSPDIEDLDTPVLLLHITARFLKGFCQLAAFLLLRKRNSLGDGRTRSPNTELI